MNRPYDYRVLTSAPEAAQCAALMAQSFVVHSQQELAYLDQVGHDQVRLLFADHGLVGGLALLPMAQWFGGQPVTMTGIASVAIAPHGRGQGAGSALMQAVVQELANAGVALSTLYPAVQRLYERVGYGQGGTHCQWKVATAAIPVHTKPLPLYPWVVQLTTLAQGPEFPGTTLKHGGQLNRHPLIWWRTLNPSDESPVWAYHLGSSTHPQGYLIYRQDRQPTGTSLVIQAWATQTPQALHSLWGFLAEHRSQVDWVKWSGAPVDPLALALPEQRASLTGLSYWMTRILNLEAALSQRGYAQGVEAELHLAIVDPVVAANQGRFILTVHQGQGHLSPGGRGDLALTIQQLASIYTGLRSPLELYRLGLIDTPVEVAALATTLFSTDSPWLEDFF